MQTRLRSDRIHAAAVASLPYWKNQLQEILAKHEAQILEQMKPLLKKRTWCGGFKYNETSARERVENPDHFYWPCVRRQKEVEHINGLINVVEGLIKKTGQGTKPFPILLSEYEFNLIWNEV